MRAMMRIRAIKAPRWWTQFRRLGVWAETSEGRIFLAILAVAGLVRLLAAPYFAVDGDLHDYVHWGATLDQHFFDFYTVAAHTSDWRLLPNYLPLGMYLFGGMEGAYVGVAHTLGLSPGLDVPSNASLTTVMKLPAILADLGITVLIFAIARRRVQTKWALLAASSYAFSLGPYLDTVWWGQTDGVVLLPVLLALIFTLRQSGLWVGVWYALAITVKPTPVIFVPLSLIYLYRWAGWRQALSALGSAVGIAAIICLPFILPPHPQLLLWGNAVAVGSQAMPGATNGAFNLWWIVDQSRFLVQPVGGIITPSFVGALMFLGAFVMVAMGVWADGSPGRLWFGASLIALAYFTLTTMQHERYLYPAVALLLISALYDVRRSVFYIVASVTVFWNIAIGGVFLPPADTIGTTLAQWRIGVAETYGMPLTMLVFLAAGANVWLVLAGLAIYLRSSVQRPRDAGDGSCGTIQGAS